MKRAQVPVVRLTHLPQHAGYTDWLLTGLGLLDAQGVLRLEAPSAAKASANRAYRGLQRRLPRALRFLPEAAPPYQIMAGLVRFCDKTVRFAYDMLDSPYEFDEWLLERCDVYFKCQCPLYINALGFPLTRRVFMPFSQAALDHQGKIVPAMLGRPLASSWSLRDNMAALDRWRALQQVPKKALLLASYGSGEAPTPSWAPGECAMLESLQGLVQHPNLKRRVLVDWLRARNDQNIRARIGNAESAVQGKYADSAEDFARVVAESVYELNVSGLRRSVTFRFATCLTVGTTVISDSLAVKWYRPFEIGTELVEIGELGYELPDEAEWGSAFEALNLILEKGFTEESERRHAVLARFESVWRPDKLAEYLVEECLSRA